MSMDFDCFLVRCIFCKYYFSGIVSFCGCVCYISRRVVCIYSSSWISLKRDPDSVSEADLITFSLFLILCVQRRLFL